MGVGVGRCQAPGFPGTTGVEKNKEKKKEPCCSVSSPFLFTYLSSAVSCGSISPSSSDSVVSPSGIACLTEVKKNRPS